MVPLLRDETTARLKKLQLTARVIVEGFLIGLHKSPYHGFSVEFSDHRQYNPGEPLRDIDWKIAAKTERYYIKRYEEETNLRSYIILDHSKSMFFRSHDVAKIVYATELSASIAWLMMSQKDAVGLITFNREITNKLVPKAYRGYLSQIFEVLVRLEPKDSTDLFTNLTRIAETIRKRSLIIIISDLLDEPEKIINALKQFRYRHHEVLVFHLTDPQEEQFGFKHETRFVDSESGEKITVTPWQIRKEYLENFHHHIDYLKAECHQAQIEYIPCTTSTPVADLLLRYLSKRAKG